MDKKPLGGLEKQTNRVTLCDKEEEKGTSGFA